MIEYCKQYSEEVARITTLINEASNLGQYERAKELIDELYELTFEYQQTRIEFKRWLKEEFEQESDPEVIKLADKCIEDLNSNDQEWSKRLNEIVSVTLWLSAKLD